MTKIAIMGAGLSGLSCAFELEKNGLSADIFEDRGEVEDRFMNLEGMLDILYRPVTDSLAYLADKHGLFLQPINTIKKLELNSEKCKKSIEGRMGFVTARGRHPQALSKQIAKQIKSKLFFDSKRSIHELTKEYDIVVIALGDGNFTRKLQKFSVDVSVTLLGIDIAGSFDPTQLTVFLDNRFAPKGYVYQMAYDEKAAHLAIATPQDNADMQLLKDRLLNHINFSGRITNEFEIRNYVIGRTDCSRIGNMFFTGNCGGFIMPFLGFGQFGSILSGIYTGKAIALGKDVSKELQPMKKSYKLSLNLRRAMECMENDDFDRLVSLMGSALGSRILTDSRYNILRLGGKLTKPYAAALSVIRN
ncbi:MAG: NAD(P)/FAD-dependent oxidoreductase [Bacillota bacterium]